MANRLEELFWVKKPIIGMIHLAGLDEEEIIGRALEELTIYQEEGVDGAIIEDYHGTISDVHKVLKESKNKFKIIRGVNTLQYSYSSFSMADNGGARFVQFDSITRDLELKEYEKLRKEYPDMIVLGGVGFKYIRPTGNSLETDLKEAMERCDAIVTTGDGTGIETPIEKLEEYKRFLRKLSKDFQLPYDFPLIVGAGVNLDNVKEQIRIADGAISGSCFKPPSEIYPAGDTNLPVDRERVQEFMDAVKEIREGL